ncbi:conserved hypothetical protein [uncultured Mycobacterium sp.]|uniref:Uncharacterized protein n=1 Tax=uncultured Mycobacterium sp. TaxID=171292 RepID=A0A1Y5PF17_9MYCO|nr:conserved hypothetical protein [uncultured Mycobacterium sp.]
MSAIPPYLESAVTDHMERMIVRDAAAQRLQQQRAEDLVLPPGYGLTEFLETPDEPAKFRIDGNLPTGGNVLVAAQNKAGKTTLIANLIRSLVDDELFLGKYKVKPVTGRIVLLDNELDVRMLRRWLREQGIEHTDQVDVIPMKGRLSTFRILEDATRARWAERLSGAEVLIGDPLRPVLDALGLSEDKEAGRFLQAWDALKVEAGADETIVVHHMGHTSIRARGDSRLIDWADVNWKIRKDSQKQNVDEFTPLDEGDGGPRYYSAYGRDVFVPEGLLEYESASRRLRYVKKPTAEEAHSAHIRPLIEAYIENSAPHSVCRNEAVEHLVGSGKAKRDPARQVFEAMFEEAVAAPEGRPYLASVGPKKAHQLTWKAGS